ncbi:hypothetical protein EXIGLDRAFT_774108 [Exidia glandulosa HHB12029]|uniref:Uncharacterized protein n=1 Tax=Exidia glandulosa HHB12029 TaxID=1314781 RepID=A0A165EI22_EXIGL|nr:hypothetical protein EXIGLDRAFT_774108 [Exidia glandulosa HHB12029]
MTCTPSPSTARSLSTFDTRLIDLDKSILPLRTSTQALTRVADSKIVSDRDGDAVEEGLFLKGPQPENLHVYAKALERLINSIAFKPSGASSRDTARLVDTGCKLLTQLFTNPVVEGSSGTAIPSNDYTPVPRNRE